MATTDYNPTARRPIAETFRATARLPVKWCVRLGIHPDVISYASVVAAAGAAACFWFSADRPSLLVLAAALCVVRLWCNMLDGMVALAARRASLRGEFVNELPDRVSDVLIFVGVAHSGWGHALLGYWAAIAALLTAYVGTLSQAVGAERQFGGWMSKPWRMFAVVVGALLTFAQVQIGGTAKPLGGLSVIDWTCLAVIAGCAQTVVVRLLCALKGLANQES